MLVFMKLLSEDEVEELRKYIVSLYRKFIPVRALAPEFGGEGEADRAEVLEEELASLGLKARRLDAPDGRAKNNVRPNILAVLRGKRDDRTLWIVGHMDTVPAGDVSAWKYPPYDVTVEGDHVYGRGVEDDGQAIVTAMALAKYLLDRDVKPSVNLGIALVSDEEVGSRYGLGYLLEKNAFHGWGENSFIVPDAGSPDGSKMIVAEKNILHFKVVVRGRQTHASTPHKGLNAHRLGMQFNIMLDEILHERLVGYNELYEPPVTTCEPTKKEANIENTNTIPGVDVVHWDCRLLPSYGLKDLEGILRTAAYAFSSSTGARVEIQVTGYSDAGEPTPPNHPLVESLAEAIRETRSIGAKPMGIGGGTVARLLRKKGYPAVVWMTCDETAHQPNEYTRLSYLISDIETLLYMLTKTTFKSRLSS